MTRAGTVWPPVCWTVREAMCEPTLWRGVFLCSCVSETDAVSVCPFEQLSCST